MERTNHLKPWTPLRPTLTYRHVETTAVIFKIKCLSVQRARAAKIEPRTAPPPVVPESGAVSCTVAYWSMSVTSPQCGAADAEIKVPYLENTELKVLLLKPGAGEYIAIYAMFTAKKINSSLLISTLPVHSPAFFSNLSRVFPVLAVANTGWMSHLSSCMLENHGPSQQSSKGEYKPWK